MDELKKNNLVLSNDDIDDACDFVEDFSEKLGDLKGRLTGTAEETATARLIRDRLHMETSAEFFGSIDDYKQTHLYKSLTSGGVVND